MALPKARNFDKLSYIAKGKLDFLDVYLLPVEINGQNAVQSAFYCQNVYPSALKAPELENYPHRRGSFRPFNSLQG